jgi:hypothetical protein
MAYSLSNPMSLVDEKAVIVWDADRNIEHFVRQAMFEGEAADFGFIVPAPTLPTVAEADGEVFSELSEFVDSQKNDRRGSTGFAGMESVDAAPAGSVEVIDQYMVGDYEASILKGSDGAAILDWLKQNGYDSRPAMEDWLGHYATMDWYFAALKFVRPEDAQSQQTTAVRVSFTTDVPFYPYKMPSDTWPKGHYRPIALYFVATGIARGQYRGDSRDWEAEVYWSGRLPHDQSSAVAKMIGISADEMPQNATLTAFHNTSNATGYNNDLFFLTYTSVLPTWAVLLVLAAMVGGIVYLFATRKKKPSENSAPG